MPPQYLKTGPGTVRQNVGKLMATPPISQSRKKAIITLARKHNLSLKGAQFYQAQRIAQSQARKPH